MALSLRREILLAPRYCRKIRSICFCRIQIPSLRVVRGLRSLKHRKLDIDELKYEQLMKEFKSEQLSEFASVKEPIQRLHVTKKQRDYSKSKILSDQETAAKAEDATATLEVTLENQHEMLAAKVTPFTKYAYGMQLKKKYTRNMTVLREFGKKLKEIKAKIAIGEDNLPCSLDAVIPSPVIEEYRNKDEFSIRRGVDGNLKTVGFFLQSTAENPDTICVGPDKLKNIKSCHKYLVKEFENYMKESPLPACFNFNDGGFWRNIIVRSNIKDEIMAIIVMHPQQLSEKEIEDEKEKLRNYFSMINTEKCKLKSLYFQACLHTRCSHAEAPFQHLLGELYIIEELCGYKFRISPESFFQTNTAAAEQLYKVILNSCRPNKSSVVLDLCCGVGPVSLILAPHAKKCIGIDTSIQAIEDAKVNAELNHVKNVEFYTGRCEDLVSNILSNTYAEEFIVVANPARSPLNNFVIDTIRECRYLRKVIFVSCKPMAAIKNFIELSKTGVAKLREPFLPMRAIPVDLFPQTEHCELVIIFQRI